MFSTAPINALIGRHQQRHRRYSRRASPSRLPSALIREEKDLPKTSPPSSFDNFIVTKSRASTWTELEKNSTTSAL
jgi:hypothetical protein